MLAASFLTLLAFTVTIIGLSSVVFEHHRFLSSSSLQNSNVFLWYGYYAVYSGASNAFT